jgi:exonuclease III
VKKRKVQEFISSNNLDLIVIQETKMEDLCHYLEGNAFCD